MALNPVGVDIGTTAVRATQVKVRRGKPVIIRAAEVPLPEGVFTDGEVRDPQALAQAIRLLWKSGRFPFRDAIVGVGNRQTMVRQVDVPLDVSDEEFSETLASRVGRDLPMDASELTMDYYGLGDYIDNQGEPRRKALIVGATNAAVENLTETVNDAKIKPVRVDFSGFALIRAAVWAYGDPKAVPETPRGDAEFTCEVVVDMGAQMTTIAIHDRGRPLFIRLVPSGGEAVTRAVADHLQLRMEVADTLKRHLGIGGVTPSDKATAKLMSEVTPAAATVAQQIVNMMASSLVQAVRESVEYYLAASPQVTGISKIRLSGGGALLPGFADRLAAELRTDVSYMKPMRRFSPGRIKTKRAALDPRFTMAFGLSTGAL